MYPIKNNKKNIEASIARASIKIKKEFIGDYNSFLSKRKFWGLRDSKTVYSKPDGNYKNNRQKLHKKIVNKIVHVKGTVDRKDPDVYFLGGMPASGKTQNLRKRVPEKAVVADADIAKERLSRVNPSGFSSYPLANAPFLHRESSDINREVIDKARREKRDLIIDSTARNPEKTAEQVQKFKAAGYDVHFLGTQKETPHAIRDAAGRFLATGRYVPLGYIGSQGNNINANVWQAAHKKGLFDDAVVVDTSDGKGGVVYQRGNIKKDYRSPS